MLLLWVSVLPLNVPNFPKIPLDAVHVLKHVSMLDVLCMGIVVVCLAADAYKKQGIYLEQQRGVLLLAAAEVIHYVTFFLVSCAVAPADGTWKDSGDDSDV